MARKPKDSDDWGEESTPKPKPQAPKPESKDVSNDPRFVGLEHLPESEKKRRLAELDAHSERMELIKSQEIAMLTHSASELERNNPLLVAFIRQDERAKVLAEMADGK